MGKRVGGEGEQFLRKQESQRGGEVKCGRRSWEVGTAVGNALLAALNETIETCRGVQVILGSEVPSNAKLC